MWKWNCSSLYQIEFLVKNASISDVPTPAARARRPRQPAPKKGRPCLMAKRVFGKVDARRRRPRPRAARGGGSGTVAGVVHANLVCVRVRIQG